MSERAMAVARSLLAGQAIRWNKSQSVAGWDVLEVDVIGGDVDERSLRALEGRMARELGRGYLVLASKTSEGGRAMMADKRPASRLPSLRISVVYLPFYLLALPCRQAVATLCLHVGAMCVARFVSAHAQ